MKWILCGLTFAMSVGLAIATAALRAENVHLRQQIERDCRRIEIRRMELGRLQRLAIEQATPERLVVQLRAMVRPPRQQAIGEVQSWQ